MNFKQRFEGALKVSVVIGIVFHMIVTVFIYVLPKYLISDRSAINESDLTAAFLNIKSILVFILMWFLLILMSSS